MIASDVQLADLRPGMMTDLVRRSKLHSPLMTGGGTQKLPADSKFFESLRKYMPGDNSENIDWKYYSRSEKVFIRQKRFEAQKRNNIILDCSRDLLWPESGVSKAQLSWNIYLDLMFRSSVLYEKWDFYLIINKRLQKFTRLSQGELLEFYSELASQQFNSENMKLPLVDQPLQENKRNFVICDGFDWQKYQKIFANSADAHIILCRHSQECQFD